MRLPFLASLLLGCMAFSFYRQTPPIAAPAAKKIITGADQTEKYIPYLSGTRVAILGNTMIIGRQGRGAYFPFSVLGNPDLKGEYEFSFKPVSLNGMSEAPLHMDKDCYGLDLRHYDIGALMKSKQLNIRWMIDVYKAYSYKEKFFDQKQDKEVRDINKLAGTRQFKEQIMAGVPEAEIRKSWEPGLSK